MCIAFTFVLFDKKVTNLFAYLITLADARVESWSENVFVDDLTTGRALETTYYVTDSKQMTDFFWYRESGTRLNVGLQNIDVVPVYDEVPHDSDAQFVLGNPALKFDLPHYLDIQRQHCRSLSAASNFSAYCYTFLRPSVCLSCVCYICAPCLNRSTNLNACT